MLRFSPLEMGFVRKSPDLLNIAFPALEHFANTNKGYLKLLKEKS